MYIQNKCVYLYQQKQNDMKTFKITYRRESGSIDFEIFKCRSIKLTKSITNHFYYINAEILSIDEQL